MPLWQAAAREEDTVAVWVGIPGGLGAVGLAAPAGRSTAGAWADAADKNANDAAIVAIATRIPNEKVRINLTGSRDREVARLQYTN
jgi:hypothetical protein